MVDLMIIYEIILFILHSNIVWLFIRGCIELKHDLNIMGMLTYYLYLVISLPIQS